MQDFGGGAPGVFADRPSRKLPHAPLPGDPVNATMNDTTLKLYVVGRTPASERAIAAIEQLRAALPGAVDDRSGRRR